MRLSWWAAPVAALLLVAGAGLWLWLGGARTRPPDTPVHVPKVEQEPVVNQPPASSGPLVVAVSLGARGLLLVSPEGAWRAVPPPIHVVNAAGSGDALVAGFAAGLIQGLPAEAVLRLAVACGTANALTESAAVVQPEDFERIRPEVRVERIA